MADEIAVDGGDGRTVEIAGNDDREDVFVDVDENDGKATGLMLKIEALEQEKLQLVHANEVVKDRVKKLKKEIEGLESDKADLKKEIEGSEEDKKALQSIAARAAELEMETSRLQHELLELEEANKEVSELQRKVEELKRTLSEKDSKVEVLEKERRLLMEKLDKNAESVKDAKAITESRVRDLEKKIEALESRESSEKNERIRVELEARTKIDQKESEILHLKKWTEDLESVVTKNEVEMERMKKEREALKIVKNELEALLKKSERKGKEMDHKVAQLQEELEAAHQMIQLKGQKSDGVNGKEKGLIGLKLHWPVVAASAGTIATVGVICYLSSRRGR